MSCARERGLHSTRCLLMAMARVRVRPWRTSSKSSGPSTTVHLRIMFHGRIKGMSCCSAPASSCQAWRRTVFWAGNPLLRDDWMFANCPDTNKIFSLSRGSTRLAKELQARLPTALEEQAAGTDLPAEPALLTGALV